jgi:hypothetical protein
MHEDQNYGLMSLDWALRTLIQMNEQLGFKDPEQMTWETTLADLTPFPVDEKTGLMVSTDQPFNKGHRHYSHLLAIYPYHTLNPDQGPEARALILKSLENWHSYGKGYAGYSYTGAAAMYATLGMGDEALEKLDGLRPFLLPNTTYREGGGPVIETPLSSVESVNYMLLQSWDDVIRVFPAVPQRWAKEVSFHELRAQGAFVVSAEMQDGQTQWVRIESLAGQPCILQTDMPKFSVESPRQIKVEPVEGPSGQKRWQVDLDKGETALLKRRG